METTNDAIFKKVLQQNLETNWGRDVKEGGEEDGSQDKQQPEAD